MIKRRFYRDTHGDKDAPSEESSSSSSGSEVEAEATDDTDVEEEVEEEGEQGEEEEEDDDEDKDKEEKVASDVREKGEASSSSGYESEDSSVNEVNLDSSGLPTSDEDGAAQVDNLPTISQRTPKKDEPEFDMTDYVLKRNSVFKCRICPRIVCLSEETLKAHLSSKKHARSEKLLNEGRLKLMLNDKGKVEGEMDYEEHAPKRASRQKSDKPNGKGKGRGKQRKRPRQDTESRKAKPSSQKREKRRKNDD